MIERQRDQGIGGEKMETHLKDSPDEDGDHERGGGPAQGAQPSNAEDGRDHHQDSAHKGKDRQVKVCTEIELDGAGKKSGLHPEPADEGKSDGERDEYGPDSPEGKVSDERRGKPGFGSDVSCQPHHPDEDDFAEEIANDDARDVSQAQTDHHAPENGRHDYSDPNPDDSQVNPAFSLTQRNGL